MGPEARVAFVTRMVETLAARLKSDGKDLGGWLRLVRAYSVLAYGQSSRPDSQHHDDQAAMFRMVDLVADRKVDAVTFTSAPAASNSSSFIS